MMQKNKLSKGFTLIELLVVLGIIAVLVSLIAFNFNQARMRARDVTRKSDLKQLQSALEEYKNDNSQVYPNASTYTDLMTALSGGGYIPSNIGDPKEALYAGSWQQYTYTYNVASNTYTMTICLENASDDMASSTTCGFSNAGRLYTYTNQ